jgi:malonyl-CoA/methylmalonyl-CoA synthetase
MTGERRAGTVGFPAARRGPEDHRSRERATLPDGEIGQIEVRGAQRVQGLLADAGKDRRGTAGRRLLHHRRSRQASTPTGYVHIVGRNKDLIISGGYNIYPKEIELILDEQPGVLESAVIGVPHADFGETVVGLIVPEPGQIPISTPSRQPLSDGLARFKQPTEAHRC